MTTVDELARLRRLAASPAGKTWIGSIHKTVADVADRVLVTITQFGDKEVWGPCPWPTMTTAAGLPILPTAGNACLVAITQDGSPWVVGWWPHD